MRMKVMLMINFVYFVFVLELFNMSIFFISLELFVVVLQHF